MLNLGTETGSLINHLYSGQTEKPVAGQFCTELLWSDRHVWFVKEVSKDGKTVVLNGVNAEVVEGSAHNGSAVYKYTVNENSTRTLHFFRGNWCLKETGATWTKEYKDLHYKEMWALPVWTERVGNQPRYLKVVAPYTKAYTKYHKVNYVFGVADHYYDPHF